MHPLCRLRCANFFGVPKSIVVRMKNRFHSKNPMIKIAEFTPCLWILVGRSGHTMQFVAGSLRNVLIYANKSIFNRFAVHNFSHSLGYECRGVDAVFFSAKYSTDWISWLSVRSMPVTYGHPFIVYATNEKKKLACILLQDNVLRSKMLDNSF